MVHRLSIGLLATAISIFPLLAKAQYGTVEDLGDVINISPKDVVSTTFADQCALQVANAGSGTFFGWLADANQVLTIGDSLSYDESLDTRFASDITWHFGVNDLDDGNVDSVRPNHSHPSALSEHDQQLRQLDSCLVGMQPTSRPATASASSIEAIVALFSTC
tara:strand:- start:777 stop:1265 length:489 start_codon:yes stop_codon:yes gene_type:complete